MKQRIRAHPFNERNMDKNFHDRRQEKTAHADIKYGGDAPETVSNAAQGRPQQAGKGGHHIDNGIGRHDGFLRYQQRNAGLHGRLISAGNPIQEKKHNQDERNQAAPPA